MDERQLMKPHKVSLNNRLSAMMTGVKEVISFDGEEVVLDTEQGVLIVKGADLHVTRLTLEKGELEMDGRIDGFMYTEQEDRRGKESLLAKLFR